MIEYRSALDDVFWPSLKSTLEIQVVFTVCDIETERYAIGSHIRWKSLELAGK